jgi:hypothetical protein
LKPVSDFSHQGDFLRTHGAMARQRAETCATCHDQTKCAECHAATTRPFKAEIQFPEEVESRFVHRGDFLSRHPIEAAADPASCRRCHGSGYCRSCHEFQGVAPGVAGGRNPHPSSFFAQHGSAARQNIVACAGCHDQGAAAICVQCHRPGGIGGNPHPPGWAGKHSPSDVSKNRMCRACHS